MKRMKYKNHDIEEDLSAKALIIFFFITLGVALVPMLLLTH